MSAAPTMGKKKGKIRLRMRLRHRLALSLVIVALLPVSVAYWVGANVVLRGLERGIHSQTENQLNVGLNALLSEIESLSHEAKRLADNKTLGDIIDDPAALELFLQKEAQFLPSSLVQIANRAEELVGRSEVPSEQPRFANIDVPNTSESILSGLRSQQGVTVELDEGQLILRATAPIVDAEFQVLGAVVLSVPMDGQFNDLLKATLGVDTIILAGPRGDGKPMMSFHDDFGVRLTEWHSSSHTISQIVSGNNTFENRQVLNHDYSVGYAPILDIDDVIVGVFGIAVNRAPVIEARSSATRSLALGAAGALFFALGLAGLLSRRISRPLQNLHHNALAISRGDLDQEIEVEEGDEFGDLAKAFAHMTDALKENQRRLAARMREIVALHDAGRAVSSVIELEQVLHKVVDSVARVLHLRVCALWIVNTDTPTDANSDDFTGKLPLVLGAARAKRNDLRNIASQQEVEELVSPLWHLAHEVALTGGSLRVDSMHKHPKHAEQAALAGIEGSLIASVLERKGTVAGVIMVGRGVAARPFSDADASLLSTFADQAATAIENASLYATVRKFNEELELKVQKRTMELQAINFELGVTITELKETQAQLTLSERLAGLGQLVAGVAHEINSPSAAIAGTAESLSRTIQRLTNRTVQLPPELNAMFATLAPQLAEKPRVPPAAIRRRARELTQILQAQSILPDTALAISMVLAELNVDESDIPALCPYFKGAEESRFILDTLWDYVFVHRSTHTIQDAIHRIQKIVGSLKSYSHLDKDASRDFADIHEGIENTLIILEYQLTRNIKIQRKYSSLPAVPIYVDELNQVWTNLIHNAIQSIASSGQPGEIAIETLAIHNGITVRITDTGPGIPDELMNRIFDPFFTTKTMGEGTGLGLGIVRQIIEKHDGKLLCESAPGRTCFEVWLPTGIAIS